LFRFLTGASMKISLKISRLVQSTSLSLTTGWMLEQ
jgi:hypothetical protein